jgi:hypothetical protein
MRKSNISITSYRYNQSRLYDEYVYECTPMEVIPASVEQLTERSLDHVAGEGVLLGTRYGLHQPAHYVHTGNEVALGEHRHGMTKRCLRS